MLAHRVSWALQHGSLDPNADVLHVCDNPPCVNPTHLFLGNQTLNNIDKQLKGRQVRGERNGSAKLTESDVIDIRTLRTFGGRPTVIADAFGITQGVVSNICARRIWKHVP